MALNFIFEIAQGVEKGQNCFYLPHSAFQEGWALFRIGFNNIL